MKVYHGIPKSVIDEHTLFYASFDKCFTPERGVLVDHTDTDIVVESTLPTGCNLGGREKHAPLKTTYSATQTFDNELTIEFWTDNRYPMGTGKYYRTVSVNGIDIIFYNNKYCSGYWDNRVMSQTCISGIQHVRLCLSRINDSTYSQKLFINGKIMYSGDTIIKKFKDSLIVTLGNDDNTGRLPISDLRISNIDRGDYFPNLPQDFIEGKAIIRPKFGQQQIKGDPMYSQVTTLKISKDFKYYNNEQSDGTFPIIDNPELFIYGNNNWGSGSKIKIKGLNGEIISGVIDTDTALCRINPLQGLTQFPSSSSIVSVKVINSSGLSVNDTCKLWYANSNFIPPDIFTIKEIVSETEIKVSCSVSGGQLTDTGEAYLIESTASSSSPTVKTADGTTVVGTWSGLGTNEAIFTLGTNTSLAGKDLYIEYALTMPYGNSDFPELPYSIEKAWGENGVEMKPVSEILITDDFKGKISGSTKECPHRSKWATHSTSTLQPSAFSSEVETYTVISDKDDIKYTVQPNVSGNIPQQLFEFDLVSIIEKKLGCEIPSNDKIKWIDDNIESISCNFYAYGVCSSGNKLNVAMYNVLNSNWYTPWVLTHANTSTLVSRGIASSDSKKTFVSPEGTIRFLFYTDSYDGSTTSAIYIDYVSLVVKFKIDSTYTTLYCENTRAREDKCNPILIQKETKTVKRYLPSKECFTTECKYTEGLQKNSTYINDKLQENMLSQIINEISTYGTGAYIPLTNISYLSGATKNYANSINNIMGSLIDTYNYSGEALSTCKLRYPTAGKYDIRRVNMPPMSAIYDGIIKSCLDDNTQILAKNYCNFTAFLVNINGEVCIAVFAYEYKNSIYSRELYLLGKLPNRPLIK